jgi:hypothetical protein
MSLNNIQLTPVLIQELYKTTLVEMQDAPGQKPAETSTSFAVLGNNRKKVAIMVANDETLYLPDDQLNFLLGILSACNLTMEDVAIVNIQKNKNVTYKAVELELNAANIILFGVAPAQIELPIAFPLYQVQAFNGQTYLAAAQLMQLQENKAEKGKLWNCLKQIFSI